MDFNTSEVLSLVGAEYTVSYFDEIGSTNTSLVEAVKRGDAGTKRIVAAGRQSAGRGRHGNSFSSRDGGIYFSFTAKNNEGDVPTVFAGVALAKALSSFGFSPEIKWVNDVLLGGKKVCGILAEAVAGTSLCVIGIGVNIKRGAIPPELEKTAASLEDFGTPPQPERIVGTVVANYERLEANGRRNAIAEYKSYLKLLDTQIEIKNTGEICTAEDVTELGELVAIRRDGTRTVLNSGEISIRIK